MFWKKAGITLSFIVGFVILNIAAILLLVWNLQEADVIFNNKEVSVPVWTIMTNKELAKALDYFYIDNVGKIFLYIGVGVGVLASFKLMKFMVSNKITTLREMKLIKYKNNLKDDEDELTKKHNKNWK